MLAVLVGAVDVAAVLAAREPARGGAGSELRGQSQGGLFQGSQPEQPRRVYVDAPEKCPGPCGRVPEVVCCGEVAEAQEGQDEARATDLHTPPSALGVRAGEGTEAWHHSGEEGPGASQSQSRDGEETWTGGKGWRRQEPQGDPTAFCAGAGPGAGDPG